MQKTISKEVKYSGIGLHTGVNTILQFCPAPPGTGIRFIRVDTEQQLDIPANIEYLCDDIRSISLENKKYKVRTVEHVLSAIYGLGINNIIIKLTGEEVPAGDGSAKEFVRLLKQADIVTQDNTDKISPIKIHTPIWVSEEDKCIVILPAEKYKISFTIHFKDIYIISQFAEFYILPEIFEQEIAPARTFGFLSEVNSLIRQRLAQGANIENTIIIDNNGVINQKLRFKDEMVRHKILDVIGDLALVGRPLLGHVIGIKSGHRLNIKLARKIYDTYKDLTE
jgi:UDP-3-O-acyl N-acetylglucosamine deacetylase